MPNTLSPELVPANDRAMVRYLGAGYGHLANVIIDAIDAVEKGNKEDALAMLHFAGASSAHTAQKVNEYIAGEPAFLHQKFSDEANAPGASLLTTYNPANETNKNVN